ncbi:MAG: hypothetical protein KKA19_05285 [Candidatus Margulisbacteria bacterium]|nr:hypothetical protein [Candidatus Margulisiibacteriota bacterium]
MILLFGCEEKEKRDFNFIFKYGYGAKNELNTFEDTYLKYMGKDPVTKVEMKLLSSDFEIIAKKMIEINFYDYPDHFAIKAPEGEAGLSIVPYQSYYFKVQKGDQVKEVWWDDNIKYESKKAEKLRDLINTIIEIIRSKDVYKNIIEPTNAPRPI